MSDSIMSTGTRVALESRPPRPAVGDTPAPICVLGIAGSLRARSYNRALLRAAVELAPPGLVIHVFDRLGELPHYNEDLDPPDAPERAPESARALRDALRAADALLVVTPEYNYGIPGVLKNALDWASRPPATTALRDMPAGIMGAAPSGVGTARAQLALRESFVWTQTYPLAAPEVLVANAAQRFDAELRLTDEPTRAFVRDHLVRLREWALRLRRPAAPPPAPVTGRRPAAATG